MPWTRLLLRQRQHRDDALLDLGESFAHWLRGALGIGAVPASEEETRK